MIDNEILEWLKQKENVSVSGLQRELSLSFPKAKNTLQSLIEEGVIEKEEKKHRHDVIRSYFDENRKGTIAITITELKRNIAEYARLAETQRIVVTKKGTAVFAMVPKVH